MAWGSVFKSAAWLVCGGGLIGLLRGSVPTGMLSGLILLGLLLAIALPVLATDYFGRKPARAVPPLKKQKREPA